MQMVIQRELRAGARRRITYWGRFLAAATAIFLLWQGSQALNPGPDLFVSVAIVASALCILDALRRAAASIAEEKSEGTLGLLILTPLSGSELLYGKFFAVAIAALPLAIAVVPIFGVSILLGGVSGGEFLRMSLAFLHSLTVAIAVGIFASSNCQSTVGATFVALVFLLFASVFFGGLTAAGIPNPLGPIWTVSDLNYRPARQMFWASLIGTQVCVFAFLWLFGRNFAKRWRGEQQSEVALNVYAQPMATAAVSSTAFAAQDHVIAAHYDWVSAPRWFKGNPVTWLTLRDMKMHSGRWTLAVIAFVCAIPSFTPMGLFYPIMFCLVLILLICIASARTFAAARQCNSLELLMTTPLGVRAIVKGHLAGLRQMFLMPSLIMIGAFAMSFLINTFSNAARDDFAFPSVKGAFAWYVLAAFALLLLATPWVGMWMGLVCKTPARAMLATVALVMILPRFAGCVMIDPIYFPLLLVIARKCVYANFRRIVAPR